jgi:hypothetical protein
MMTAIELALSILEKIKDGLIKPDMPVGYIVDYDIGISYYGVNEIEVDEYARLNGRYGANEPALILK